MGEWVGRLVLAVVVAGGAGGALAQMGENAQRSSAQVRALERRAERAEERPWIEVPSVTAAEARGLLGRPGVHVVDVTCAARAGDLSHQLPGTQWRDCARVEEWAPAYPRGDTLLVYCACGDKPRSARVVQQLQRLGFSRAIHLVGGFDAWEDAGFPLEPRP